MLTALRLLSILLGVLLSAAPAVLALQFAHGVGEAPSTGRMTDFVLPLLILGLPFGLGPLLAGLPRTVCGQRTPVMRVVVGLLLVVSAGGLVIIGMGGSVMVWVSPVVCLLEAAIFAAFIWPARTFRASGE